LPGASTGCEREMRAVQRKVFPGRRRADDRAADHGAADAGRRPGDARDDAVADLNARVSALETSVRSVTGQAEQATYRVAQLEEAFAAYRARPTHAAGAGGWR
jgi:hypothetical protein